ncbi:MAG TPA: hypothetical protein VEL74_22255 [Thermoanaerobaculia bacterium]|nr:hypothetical protein [Thermoanaerobaculia bacterium]
MIEMRPTTDNDLPALSALFADRFGHPLGAEEWLWKYRQIPGEGRSLVAVEEGEVVAHAGALRLPARWRGGDAGIWQLVDFAGTTRRGGLRPALVELGRRLLADLPGRVDAPWIFGFPSERHFRLGQRVFGYRPLTVLTPLGGEIPEGVPGPLETGDSCGEWAGAVWERCGLLGVRRSAGFLNWRYHARPHRYYRFYRLYEGDLEGLAVFAFVGEEAWAAEVWLPAPGRWYPAMSAVAADLRASGLRTWRFWPSPGGRLASLYQALGLRELEERRFIGCRGRADGGGEAPEAAAAGFHYAMGDYDLV